MIVLCCDVPAPTSGTLANFAKCALEGMARGYAAMMPFWRLPPLYRSGIRFAYEPHHGTGIEDWAAPLTTYRRKCGDCDDLVIYRLAELYAGGEERASCRALWLNESVHVLVRRADGTIEDPAVALGAPHP